MRGSTASSSAIRPAEPAAAATSFHTCDEFAERGRAEHGEQHELRQQAAAHAPRQHVARAEPQHEHHAAERQRHRDRDEEASGWPRRRAPRRRRSRLVGETRLTAPSAPNACMVRTAPRLSEAKAVASASVSWARRERRRTTRPEAMSGAAMTGMATSTNADSLGLV